MSVSLFDRSRKSYRYVIVGAGTAGVSAADAVHESDPDASIALIGREKHSPYHRPPLTKGLWFGRKLEKDIFFHPDSFYPENGIDLFKDTTILRIDPADKTVQAASGDSFRYDRLLLATGGTPRRLEIPGGDIEGIVYYRSYDDYLEIRKSVPHCRTVLIIGSGFIGSEMAAALLSQNLQVTMLFPGKLIGETIFPPALARSINELYVSKGVVTLSQDTPASITREKDTYTLTTRAGRILHSDLIIAGIGITPKNVPGITDGLTPDGAVSVDEYLRTRHDSIYAAGDNTSFFYPQFGKPVRFEHWDCAITQGRTAGLNMAGTAKPYDHLPYFFSDLFDFGYEAFGICSSGFETLSRMEDEFTGIVYYHENGTVRGVLTCNIFGKYEQACSLIGAAVEDIRHESFQLAG